MAFSAMPAQLNVAVQPHRRWDSTGACPVKYFAEIEQSEFNRGAGKGFFPTFIVGIQKIFIYLWALYSKVKGVNTATRNIEKNYYRVDKKITS